jgi:TPR repeat protein
MRMKKDLNKAIYWYKKAVEQEAQENLDFLLNESSDDKNLTT